MIHQKSKKVQIFKNSNSPFNVYFFRHPTISQQEKDLILISLGKQPYNNPSDENSIGTNQDNDLDSIDFNDEEPIIQLDGLSSKKVHKKIPLRDIFTSIPVYAIIIGHCCQGWGFYTLLTEMPTYLYQILHFDIKEVNNFFFTSTYLYLVSIT